MSLYEYYKTQRDEEHERRVKAELALAKITGRLEAMQRPHTDVAAAIERCLEDIKEVLPHLDIVLSKDAR